MSWSAPHTYVVGELVTAATLNADIRDNLEFLFSPPTARVYNNANISIPNNTVTPLTYNSERWDNASIHDTGSNTGRLTAPIDGVYLVSLHVWWASGSNNRYIAISLNGATEVAIQEAKGLSSTTLAMSVSTKLYMTSTQFVDSEVLQNTGGNLNVVAAGNYSPEFSMTWLGDGS